MSKNEGDYQYEQKKINHVFHYTPDFRDLQKIIREGFAPSYCKERIGDSNYLTPMVSFCNIPISEVDNYMRYGKNGIGMSLSWAIKKGLTPVTYVHENSPYHSVLKSIDLIRSKFNFLGENDITLKEFLNDDNLIEKSFYHGEINTVALSTLRYLKNWITDHKGGKIITYQEREWRFVPSESKIKPIIQDGDREYFEFKSKPKPHFPEYPLEIDKLDDVRYIVVTTDAQRDKVTGTLNNRFSKQKTVESLINGKLSILTASQIRNDF